MVVRGRTDPGATIVEWPVVSILKGRRCRLWARCAQVLQLITVLQCIGSGSAQAKAIALVFAVVENNEFCSRRVIVKHEA